MGQSDLDLLRRELERVMKWRELGSNERIENKLVKGEGEEEEKEGAGKAINRIKAKGCERKEPAASQGIHFRPKPPQSGRSQFAFRERGRDKQLLW